TNAGTVNWTDTGAFYVQNNNSSLSGAIYNLAGGLWDFQNDPSYIYCYYCNGYELFNNAGKVEKSGGTGTSYINLPFYNTGAVVAQTGVLDFENGGLIAGDYSASNGAAIYFTGGSFSNSVSAVLTGPGAIAFTGGSLTLANNVIPGLQLNGGTLVLGTNFQGGTITNLTLSGSVLSGNWAVSGTFNCGDGFSGSLLVASAATMNWSGGNAAGSLTVASNGVLNVSGNGTKYLEGAVTNAGTVNWTDTGAFYVQNNNSSLGGAIYNLAGGLWDFQNDPSYVYCYYCNGYELFNNAGTVEKSGGTGTSYIELPFYNTGAAVAQTGVLDFENGGPIAGAYSASNGAAIYFSSGSFSNSVAAVLTGPGAIAFTGGTLT